MSWTVDYSSRRIILSEFCVKNTKLAMSLMFELAPPERPKQNFILSLWRYVAEYFVTFQVQLLQLSALTEHSHHSMLFR